MKYLFPNQNVRSPSPVVPKLVQLVIITSCVCTFDNIGFWSSELKNFSETDNTIVPVSSNAIAVKFGIVNLYVVFSSSWRHFTETIVVSSSSQYNMGDVKPENWPNSFNR